MLELGLTDSEKARYLAAARLCGYWMVNGQNTQGRPWGVCQVDKSADEGRFVEKASLSRDRILPAGVWLTGVYLGGLTSLVAAPVLARSLYEDAIPLGARFLKSLQCVDKRWPGGYGGFHELRPGMSYSAARDAATGAFGLMDLYRYTQDQEYLDRAVLFGEWYSTYGTDPDGYPWDDFDLEKGEGTSPHQGDWQAGGTLIYYKLWQATGEDKWKAPLEKALDKLVDIWANDPGTDTAYTFHGQNVISIGNDDFANTALLAGYLALKKQAYLDCVAERLRKELARQDERGAFPGYGGTGVTALELLEVLEFHARGIEILPEEDVREALLRAAAFCLELQDRTSPNRFVHGGLYGESNYSWNRDSVHGRDTGYGLQLFLRMAGYRASMYTVFG